MTSKKSDSERENQLRREEIISIPFQKQAQIRANTRACPRTAQRSASTFLQAMHQVASSKPYSCRSLGLMSQY